GTLALYAQLLAARMQPLGFNQDNLLMVNSMPFVEVPSDEVLVNALEAIPGVQNAIASMSLPSNSDTTSNRPVLVRSTTDTAGPEASRITIVPGHFNFLEIPIIAGREFDAERDSTVQQSG